MLTAYYCVPLVIQVANWICEGRPLFRLASGCRRANRKNWSRAIFSLLVSAAIASDNPYWAFFSGFFFVVAGLIGRFRYSRKASLLSAAILSTVIVVVFCANLAPTLWFAHKHGLNPVNNRQPAEAEVYGLKVVQMLLPVPNHRLQSLANLAGRYYRSAPLVNENYTASLGIVGALGFAVLVGSFFWRRCPRTLASLALLNLMAVLLGTIGGLGSAFSFFVWPQYRSYNRISVYISFLSLAAFFIALELLLRRIVRASDRKLRAATAITALAVLYIGLADEIPAHFLPNRAVVEKAYTQDGDFVRLIQRGLPAESMVFELPYVPFLGPVPANTQMMEYDELKGYLHSSSLRWSAGAVIGRNNDLWIREMSAKPIPDMLDSIVNAGFAGVYIDRFGYPAGIASEIEARLRTATGATAVVSLNGRRSYFPLAGYSSELGHERMAITPSDVPVPALEVQTGDGCWPLETAPNSSWHWCGTRGEIVLTNHTNRIQTVELRGKVFAGVSGSFSVWITVGKTQQVLPVTVAGTNLRARLQLRPGETILRLRCNAPILSAPGDARRLVFRLVDLQVTKLTSKSQL
jgi:phosphoglycerol transferase